MADRPQAMTAQHKTQTARQELTRDASISHYVSEFESFPLSLGGEPAERIALRRKAIARFAELGFPTIKNEDWHFTSVAPISSRAFRLTTPAAVTGVKAAEVQPFTFGQLEWPTMVFVNGRFVPGLSRIPATTGVKVLSLREAMEAGEAGVDQLCSVTDFEGAVFTALNTAFFSDGAYIVIEPDAAIEVPLHVVFVSAPDGPDTVTHPRNLVVVGRNARAAIIESYVGFGTNPYFTNAVTEIVLSDGAKLDYLKIQRESPAAFHVGTIDTQQGRDSSYHSFSYATGADLSRTNIYTILDGEGGSALLHGLYMADGTQHVDHQTRIEHAKPSCTSFEVYKGVLDGRSHGVFNGKVFVRPEAQKTDGKQSNNNLLLSPHAQVDTKPQLEIFADDVKCTHGATVGRLDENALFYMRSRGIDVARARTLLTYAFAAEVLEEITIAPVREELERLVLARVSGGTD
jgi:Fe-S cluster assembly protein SufD